MLSALKELPSWRAEFLADLTTRCDVKGKRLLEIGAGDCLIAEVLGRDYEPSVVFATDLSLPKRAGNRIVRAQMDAARLQFPSNYFDIVYSHNAFEHISDLRRAWSEIVRVLRPGGRIFCHFAPIWTHSFGHHCYEEMDKNVRCAIPPYGHLYLPKKDLEKLVKQSTRVLSESRRLMREYLFLHGCNKLWPKDYRAVLLGNPLLKYIEAEEIRGHHHDRPLPEQLMKAYPHVRPDEFAIVGWQIFAEKTGSAVDETDENFFSLFDRKGLASKRSRYQKFKARLKRLKQSL